MTTSFGIETPTKILYGHYDGYPSWCLNVIAQFFKSGSESLKEVYLSNYDNTRDLVEQYTAEHDVISDPLFFEDELVTEDWTYVIDANKRITIKRGFFNFNGNINNANPFSSMYSILPEHYQEQVNKIQGSIDELKGMGYTFAYEDPELQADYHVVGSDSLVVSLHESQLLLATLESIQEAREQKLPLTSENLVRLGYSPNHNDTAYTIVTWSSDKEEYIEVQKVA